MYKSQYYNYFQRFLLKTYQFTCTAICRVQAYVQSSPFGHHVNTRKVNLMLDSIGHDLQKSSPVAVDSSYSAYRDILLQRLNSDGNLGIIQKESPFAARLRASLTPLEFPSSSPNALYLQTLKEYVAERSGTLGEGWHVEFEFSDIRHKTSAIYVAPDGRRFRSMEDVALHFGLPPRHHYLENDNVSTGPASIRSGTTQNSRQRQKVSRASKNQGFLSSLGVKSFPDFKLGSSEHGGPHERGHVSI